MYKKLILFLTFTTCLFAEQINTQAIAEKSAYSLLDVGAIGAVCVILFGINIGLVVFLVKKVIAGLEKQSDLASKHLIFSETIVEMIKNLDKKHADIFMNIIEYERKKSEQCYTTIVSLLNAHKLESIEHHNNVLNAIKEFKK